MAIFDAYVEDLIQQDKAKEKKGKGQSTPSTLPLCVVVTDHMTSNFCIGGGEEVKKEIKTGSEISSDDITRVKLASKIMERMVNQNTFDEIAQGAHTHTRAHRHMARAHTHTPRLQVLRGPR